MKNTIIFNEFLLHIFQIEIKDCDIPKPILNENFMENLKALGVEYSMDPQDRLFRAHGLNSFSLYSIIILLYFN